MEVVWIYIIKYLPSKDEGKSFKILKVLWTSFMQSSWGRYSPCKKGCRWMLARLAIWACNTKGLGEPRLKYLCEVARNGSAVSRNLLSDDGEWSRRCKRCKHAFWKTVGHCRNPIELQSECFRFRSAPDFTAAAAGASPFSGGSGRSISTGSRTTIGGGRRWVNLFACPFCRPRNGLKSSTRPTLFFCHFKLQTFIFGASSVT